MKILTLVHYNLQGYLDQIDYSQQDIGGINHLAMTLDSSVTAIEDVTLRLLISKAQEQLRDAASVLNHEGDESVAGDMLGVSAYWLGKAVYLAKQRGLV